MPAGDQLLVLSEKGELVLLRATPDQWSELGRLEVLSGRTWNHPVLVGNRLYLRNAQEAVCYEVSVVEQAPPGESQEEANRRKPANFVGTSVTP